MFIEIGGAALAYGIYKSIYRTYKTRDLRTIKKEFDNLMENYNLDYQILNVTKNDIGYKVIVNIKGLGLEKLEKMKGIIETVYNSTIEVKQSDNNKAIAIIDIIVEELTDDYKFTPVKNTKPWELYLGKTYTMKDIIVSMQNLPHMLYSGINSSGKTYCVLTALTNLIHYHNEREIEIFLSQISAKKDLRKFKDVKQCRGYAVSLEETYDMFNYLYHTMLKRINMFNSAKSQFIDTIFEWNKAFPQRKMRIIYLAMDEFTAYMPDNLDSKEDAEIKQKCLDLLVKLIQQCRACGIYILTSLQRPDKESLPPRLKAQFNCKVSFKQPNIASSLVVCDSDKAYYLKPKREAIVNADDEYLMKTLYLDNHMISDFIKDSLDMTHKNYYNYKKPEEAIKETVTTGSKQDKQAKVKSKTKSKARVKKVKA